MNPVGLVVLVNIGLTLLGMVFMANRPDSRQSDNIGVYLLSLLPMLIILLAANAVMLFLSIFIKAERERAPGYFISIGLYIVVTFFVFWGGLVGMGKIGG